jgi:hypothetical protein
LEVDKAAKEAEKSAKDAEKAAKEAEKKKKEEEKEREKKKAEEAKQKQASFFTSWTKKASDGSSLVTGSNGFCVAHFFRFPLSEFLHKPLIKIRQ